MEKDRQIITLGVDIGGTFTDICCIAASGDGDQLHWTKVPSTPKNPAVGVLQATDKILEVCGGSPDQVIRFIHGTTVATNAVLEEKGARIGILMTRGFEDTLEMGRQRRSNMYKMDLDPETPVFLAPGRRRIGIAERINAQGKVLVPLDEEEVRIGARKLREQFEVEAIAVCYIFSFINPAHELRTREIILGEYPDLRISLSHEIDPVFREYERLCVTAFDAYLRPVVQTYVRSLQDQLRTAGIAGELLTMRSGGGIASFETAVDMPVTTLLSGPAAGVIGAKFIAERSGFPNIITLDMGGTSADVALVTGGKAITSTEGRIREFPLRTPMVDVNTIGAGGGSIAWLDAGGGLKVGPKSAGADPGPACYGLGGQEATVTDASLVLGYLDPTFFAGGEVELDPDAAWRAVERIAEHLSLSVPEAAYGIHRIVNAKMADAIRLVSLRRGYDQRHFALFLFGGAGPVNGGMVCEELAIPTAIIPEAPGVLSAFGLLVANIEHNVARTFVSRMDMVDLDEVASIMRELMDVGIERIRKDGVPESDVVVDASADMRYSGQSYELEVPIKGDLTRISLQAVTNEFHNIHEQIYGHGNRQAPVEFVNLRLAIIFPLPKPLTNWVGREGDLSDALLGHRQCCFGEHVGFVDTPIYMRTELPVDKRTTGPAIIQQRDTTTVVYPGQECHLDHHGNLVVTWGHEDAR